MARKRQRRTGSALRRAGELAGAKAAAGALAAGRRERASSDVQVIAEGVRSVAADLEGVVTPGSLYWTAPNHYVAMQAAPRICAMANLPPARADDVAEYVVAAMNEFLVSLVEGFDVEHFDAWIAAARRPREAQGE